MFSSLGLHLGSFLFYVIWCLLPVSLSSRLSALTFKKCAVVQQMVASQRVLSDQKGLTSRKRAFPLLVLGFLLSATSPWDTKISV